MGGQEQSEIPAWLESLRVGERPASPANAPVQFSAADIIDEGTLPTWMRSGRGDSSGMPAPDAFQSAAVSPTNLGVPPKGLNAQSLIDEKSLPSWMQEKGTSQSSQPQRGFDASSLVEQDSLPDWMKSLQPQAPSSPEARTASPAPQPKSSPGEVPNWMQNLQPPMPVQQQPGAVPVTPPGSFTPPAKGFSAADLLDEQSLPSWMSQQGGGAPVRDDRPRQPNSLSPSSLIDQDALPSWMKESGSSQQNMPPQSQNQPMQAPAFNGSSQNAFSADQGLAGASLIDPNSLPEWLRSSVGQMGSVPPSSQQSNMPNMSYNAAPSRVENVRVPSRPRSDRNADQNNEAAANAFASVLGVASNAPQLPSSMPPQSPYGQYAPAPGPEFQNMPPLQQPGQMPAPGNPGIPPQAPNSWYGSAAQPGYNNAGPYVPGSNVPPGAAMGPSAPGGVPPQYQYPPAPGSGMMPPPSGSASPGMQMSGKKRSLVDRLLGWLSR